MKPIRKYLGFSSFVLCWLLVPYSFVQAATDKINLEQVTRNVSPVSENATPTHIETPATKEMCADPCQQFGKFAEPVIDKSMDDSKAISNLTNSIYLLTMLIMFFTVVAPFLMIFFQNRQGIALKEQVDDKIKYMEKEVNIKTSFMEKENNQLRQDVKDMEGRVLEKLRHEFMGGFRNMLNEHTEYYKKSMQWEMTQQSGKHEDRLYHVEQVHLDLLDQSKPKEATIDSLSEWIIGQHKDYFALLQLISPEETETFKALSIFEDRERLPDSFLSLLRFLDKQHRLPGVSRTKAAKIAQEKFGKQLVVEV